MDIRGGRRPGGPSALPAGGEGREARIRRSNEAELLLAHVLGVDLAWLIAHDEEEIPEQKIAAFAELVDRRRAGEPFAYLVGSRGFYGREFFVDRRVLIPRPETEHLVEEALAHLLGIARPRALDVGTGSGAIACTLAAELPEARIDATEISKDALAVARPNRERYALEGRVRFYEGDLVAPLAGRRYHAIVANLPYVPSAIAHDPEPVTFEPLVALDGGPDGLDLYRRLFPSLPQMLEPGGIVLAEAAPPTMERLVDIARAAFPRAEVTVGKDYAGLERFVRVQSKEALSSTEPG
jgi:release factor glutamine methyltransferase